MNDISPDAAFTPDFLSEYELPRLARLKPNLFAACFPLMKLLPARFMLDRAEANGDLRPGGTIIETTSGTFGLALAMLAAVRGYKLILVTNAALIDTRWERRVRDLGARIEVTEDKDGSGDQGGRLALLSQILRDEPEAFWPRQYDNPDNPMAYARFAEFLVRRLGKIDYLVGSVGSGGSTCGTARFLRQVFPEMRVLGVDTHRSVLFGQPVGRRLLRGLGNSIIPQNVDHRAFDEVHWVGALQAFLATRAVHRAHALFVGGTSGAASLVAHWAAERQPHHIGVVIFPDEGTRYQDTIYDDLWLNTLENWPPVPAVAPVWLEKPLPAQEDAWTAMAWGRAPLARAA